MKVTAKVRCFVDNSLREQGETFDYEGPKNPNLDYGDAETARRTRKEKETEQE